MKSILIDITFLNRCLAQSDKFTVIDIVDGIYYGLIHETGDITYASTIEKLKGKVETELLIMRGSNV